jgi:hypothetical protein
MDASQGMSLSVFYDCAAGAGALVAASVVGTWCKSRGTEWRLIATSYVHDTVVTLRDRGQQRRAQRERRAYGKRSDADIKREIDRLVRPAEWHGKVGQLLQRAIDRERSLPKPSDDRMDRLVKRALSRLELNAALLKRAEHIQTICVSIREERERDAQQKSLKELPRLIKQLDSQITAFAESALARLNQLAPSINWEDHIPKDVPDLARAKLVKVYRLMVGTNILGEARAAKKQAEQILDGLNAKKGE